MVSINNNEEYALSCDNYANNFSISLKDLLQQQKLIDVTLVADGHLFNAHRLVLSALSPYFLTMFAQMPANQQAFVFFNDVSKETLEDLMTFIYSGKVNVKQEHLEEFFKTAKALDIKGLADGEYANSCDIQPPVFNSVTPNYNGLQYQSTRTIPVPDQIKSNLYEPSHYEPPINNLYEHQNNFEYKAANELNINGNGNGDIFGSDIGDADSTAMEQEYASQDDQWNDYSTYDAELKPAKTHNSMAKRAKADVGTSEYNTVADIRINSKGQQNLFVADHKFNRHHGLTANGSQRWQCTQRQTKCRAAARTMEVNGTVMMKILCAEHTHE